MKLILFFLIFFIPSHGWPVSSSTEYGIKAAYLLNFTKYTEWPTTKFTSDRSPLTICVFGEDPFGEILDKNIAGKETTGRKIEIRRILNEPLDRLCHVIFLKRDHQKDQEQVLRTMKDWNVLTVGETEAFAENGGMIAFINVEDSVQFEINLKNVEQGGLKMSSRMLTLAKKVVR